MRPSPVHSGSRLANIGRLFIEFAPEPAVSNSNLVRAGPQLVEALPNLAETGASSADVPRVTMFAVYPNRSHRRCAKESNKPLGAQRGRQRLQGLRPKQGVDQPCAVMSAPLHSDAETRPKIDQV